MINCDSDFDLYKSIFFPIIYDETQCITDTGVRFAYYTTAETAANILQNREIWMRSTVLMNDYSEIQYGLSKITDAFSSKEGEDLEAVLEKTIPGSTEGIKDFFHKWVPNILEDTFIISFSEHTADEDQFGRLSMWRAYGGDAGVAFLINPEALFNDINILPVYTSPVSYFETSDVIDTFSRITDEIRRNGEYVQGLGLNGLRQAVFNALRFAAVCIKHPAFKEEREWRVITSPSLDSSEYLRQSVELIGGVPQPVIKKKIEMPLMNGNGDLKLPDYVDKILIGPCEFPEVIERAMVSMLSEAGVENPDEKVHVTGIPLRPNQR